MPRSNDDSPRRRRKDRYRSEDRSRSSSRGRRGSRERDRHRKKDSRTRRRSISNDPKKSYDPSPTSYQSTSSHRSKRRSTSKHRSNSRHRSRTDYKKSRHRRDHSSSASSSSSSSTSRSKSRSRKRSSSSDDIKVIEPVISKEINLDSATNEEKRRQLIEEIDADNFVPKVFSSNSTKKVSDKVIIDLQKETISVPKVEKVNPLEDEIIHPNFLGNDEERMDKWIRKLYVYRQKYFDE